ncbi:MAG: hypothetical protein C0424_10215 [Sphingobacteriaceae bacterium]|nr:hypothetical protein [Sphingobacteriaceae bacterium]
MKKQLLSFSILAGMALFAACGSNADETTASETTPTATEEAVVEESVPEEAVAEETPAPASSQPATPATQSKPAATTTDVKATTPAQSDEAVPAKEEGKKSMLRKAADAAQASE